jgi:hypothetical protein
LGEVKETNGREKGRRIKIAVLDDVDMDVDVDVGGCDDDDHGI